MSELTKTVCEIHLENKMGMILLFVNILFPGFGTIIAGIFSKSEEQKKAAITVGIIQVITAPCLIGFLWAIYTGWKIYLNDE